MKVSLKPGSYVLAVSGGIDSMVLMDVLAHTPGIELVIAHFDHGIRPESSADRQLVQKTAETYGLPFVFEEGHLGPAASEDTARNARYAFLQRVRQEVGATAIITAHHQDDLLETAVMNLLRGTGRKGLSSLDATGDVCRPFLHVPKEAICRYAHVHPAIVWREDPTNQSDRYARNYIRHHVLPGLGQAGRAQLLAHIRAARAANPIIDELLQRDIAAHTHQGKLDRQWFIMLPHAVACEVMAVWLRTRDLRSFDKRAIERLVVAAKTGLPGKHYHIYAGSLLETGKTDLQITHGSLS